MGLYNTLLPVTLSKALKSTSILFLCGFVQLIAQIFRFTNVYLPCLMVKFGGPENWLDVLTKYEILGLCGLGLNRLKFYRTKIWDIMSKNQISANRDISRVSRDPEH